MELISLLHMACGPRPSHDTGRLICHDLLHTACSRSLFCGFLVWCMSFSAAGRASLCRAACCLLCCAWWAATRPPDNADCLVDCFARQGGQPMANVCSFTLFSACSPVMTISGVGVVCYEWCGLMAFYLSAWRARLGGHQL